MRELHGALWATSLSTVAARQCQAFINVIQFCSLLSAAVRLQRNRNHGHCVAINAVAAYRSMDKRLA